MDPQQEVKELKDLPPQKYTIRILVRAVICTVAGVSALFGILMKVMDNRVTKLSTALDNKNVIIASKDKELLQCKEDARIQSDQQYREQVEYERAQKRVSDSMYYALTAAQRAVQNAIKNEKR